MAYILATTESKVKAVENPVFHQIFRKQNGADGFCAILLFMLLPRRIARLLPPG